MALSLALHGLALVPLAFAGTSGNAPSEAPVIVELSLAASAPAPTPDSAIDIPTLEPAPAVDGSEIASTTVELPSPDEPPPLQSADVKPIEPPPPPPKPQPKPQAAPAAPPKATPRPASAPAVTQTASPPDTGTAQVTQTAASPQSAIVWENNPRFRTPPRPAAYPPRAIELGHQGEALVRVRLDPDGSAAEIVLFRGTGFEMLDRAALAAVRSWQFLPAIRDGHAVAAWVQIPVRFNLR